MNHFPTRPETISSAAYRQRTSVDYGLLRQPSWCLSNLLNIIVGTEDVIALRRKIYAVSNYMTGENPKSKHLISGSKAEGFEFMSSDLDYMLINKYTIVTESIKYISDNSQTILLIRSDSCNPGFVILQLVNGTNDLNIWQSLVQYKHCAVLSSLLYRDQHHQPKFSQEGHGPCNTIYGETMGISDIDVANCFECNQWPSQAYGFIHRPRPHGWPSKALLDKIITGSCHVVPIGDKDHDLSYIQWRLSFSAAEKALVHSFNHTQFLEYGLMKIFLKQVINKVKSVKDILCSYFLKTVLFYSIEGTPQLFWRKELIIPCFWFCFNKLIKWVEHGYCPNYFVPENNMFRYKVCGENRLKLLNVLNKFKAHGWKCISLCDAFHPFQKYLGNKDSIFYYGFLTTEHSIEKELDCLTFTALRFCRQYFNTSPIQRSFSRLCRLVYSSKTVQEKNISILGLLGYLNSLGKHLCCSKALPNNKSRYRSLKKGKVLLQKTAITDVSEGPLTLATHYYTTGQYNNAVKQCQCIISQWKPFVLYAPVNQKSVTQLYERYVCGHGVDGVHKASKAYTARIVIEPNYKNFYPPELLYDVDAESPFFTYIPPLPYTTFLLCLCHIKLGNIDSGVAAFHDLQVLVGDEAQGFRRYPIVINLLAICLDKLGYLYSAIHYAYNHRS